MKIVKLNRIIFWIKIIIILLLINKIVKIRINKITKIMKIKTKD